MPGVGFVRWMWALFLGLVASVLASCGVESPPYAISIGAEHRIVTADDSRFAEPDFDDSSWQKVSLPALWRVRTTEVEVFAWHRIHFDVPADMTDRRLALDLGTIAWSDEAFVNGRLIGATGFVDRVPRLGPRPRLYSVPADALREGANVLAIRVRGIPNGPAGLLSGRMGIGDEIALERAHAEALSRTQLVEGLLLGFLGFGWLLVAFYPKRGRAGRATLFLLASITGALVQLWLLSVTFRRAGLSPEVGAHVVLGVVSLVGAFYGAFVATLTRGTMPRVFKVLIAVQVLLACLFFLWVEALGALIMIGVVVGILALSALLWLLVGAAREHSPGAIPVLVGCALSAVSVAAMLVLPSPFVVGLPLLYYGLVVAIASAVLALLRHVYAMDQQVRRATEYSLEAHRRERSRLARDLHDGLGQMLALLKMQMQRMSRKHEGEPTQKVFDESAGHVAATLDELRRVARDLRPAPMQDRSFGVAVREYAEAVAQRTDLLVDVDGDFSDPLGSELGDELYRITQECLTNCLKHSGARRIVVSLAELGDRYQLVVADDGRGLSEDVLPGLGLTTIRERSELLGGKCAITAAEGGGTRVEISVPR